MKESHLIELENRKVGQLESGKWEIEIEEWKLQIEKWEN